MRIQSRLMKGLPVFSCAGGPCFYSAAFLFVFLFAHLSVALAQSAPAWPEPREGDYIARDFHFKDGSVLPELRLHYRVLGQPRRDSSGHVDNAVLILHGTGGAGTQFLNPRFAGVLFSPGGLLDATKYFIVLPDDIGHGKSSKPSDGLHLRFPNYSYEDMVRLEYKLVTEKLGINHMRLVMGTSMGAMHTWMWGYMYPDFMDALMPLASAPVEIGGRKRILRKLIMDAIRTDPEFKGGEYTGALHGMLAAQFSLFIMTSSPLQLYLQNPTRE